MKVGSETATFTIGALSEDLALEATLQAFAQQSATAHNSMTHLFNRASGRVVFNARGVTSGSME
jgi:hypothetical protein